MKKIEELIKNHLWKKKIVGYIEIYYWEEQKNKTNIWELRYKKDKEKEKIEFFATKDEVINRIQNIYMK